MGQFLQIAERNDLVKVLSRVNDFAIAPSRMTVLGLANLDRFVAELGLDANTKQFVGQLVLMLEKYGPLDDQPGVHALGALLGTVIDTDDVPLADRTFLARLTLKYTLSNDPAYLDQLREKYSVSDPPVQSALPAKAQMPTPSKLAAAPEPDFAIGVADRKGLETIINSEDNFLDLALLSGALACARAVCLVEAPEGT